MKISDTKARISPEEIDILREMFDDREGAVNVIRKIFYPELTADNPIGANSDMWTGSNLHLDGMTPEQQVLAVTARIQLVDHVEGRLQVIRLLLGNRGESSEETLERINKERKDSTK